MKRRVGPWPVNWPPAAEADVKALILDKLGQGGIGLVLKAEHRRMKRVVALKVLSPQVRGTEDAERCRPRRCPYHTSIS